MQRVLMKLKASEEFTAVYLDDIIIFSKTLQDHLKHLKAVFSCLREASLKLKPIKCRFICQEVEYLGHIVTPKGLKPNTRNLIAVKEFPTPSNLKQLRQFLGLTSHYRRFILNYARIAEPLYFLTKKNSPFCWTADCQQAYDLLKSKLLTAPVLVFPDFTKPFTLETDASIQGLGAILSQVQNDDQLHPLAYASRSLSRSEKNYAVTELETLAVVWAVTHFRYYLYGNKVTVFTDHAAVRAVLGVPNLNGKHAHWWSKVYGSGIREIDIVYQAGKHNCHADALSRQPVLLQPSDENTSGEMRVALLTNRNDATISALLEQPSQEMNGHDKDFSVEQHNDVELQPIIAYFEENILPEDKGLAQKTVAEAVQYTMSDGILYFVGCKQTDVSRAVVPKALCKQIMEEYHGGNLAGHFSGPRLYKTLARRWWWQHMYRDAMKHANNCPQCAIVEGTGRKQKPPLTPIPTQHPFQVIGVDIMELPLTTKGNRYLIVFQDLFTKWPMAYPASDQKTERIARLLVEEIIPFFGVPEALLSDRGTNLLSYLMRDVCKMLGIEKLNTTAYHPQCNGAVERFNRTLKAMLRKHVMKFGVQWDQYLHGVLWAYRNTPHSSTGEKPSYLLFGFDCRFPTEAALLPTRTISPTNISDYREELTLSLSFARTTAMKTSQESQRQYKGQYDKTAVKSKLQIGDWVLVYFPHDETGKMRKLSQPWHGPYRVISKNDTDVTVMKIYFPDDPQIQVHLSRVQPCPPSFPRSFYWYGGKRTGPGRPPKWIKNRLKQIEVTLNKPPEVATTEVSVAKPTLNPENADIIDKTLTTISADKDECRRKNEQKPTMATKTTISEQPTEGRYNLRSQARKETLESSLTDRGDM